MLRYDFNLFVAYGDVVVVVSSFVVVAEDFGLVWVYA